MIPGPMPTLIGGAEPPPRRYLTRIAAGLRLVRQACDPGARSADGIVDPQRDLFPNHRADQADGCHGVAVAAVATPSAIAYGLAVLSSTLGRYRQDREKAGRIAPAANR